VSWPGRAGADEAGLVGDDDELGAVAGVQFHHGPLDVGAYRVRAEVIPASGYNIALENPAALARA
jgi:hypothetical protein